MRARNEAAGPHPGEIGRDGSPSTATPDVWPVPASKRPADQTDSMPCRSRTCTTVPATGGSEGKPYKTPIVGQIAIPAHFTLFGGKAFPGKGLRQGRKRLLLATLSGAFVGSTMHAAIDAFTPDVCLTVEFIDVAEADACPEALF